jgi:hypothetical protein
VHGKVVKKQALRSLLDSWHSWTKVIEPVAMQGFYLFF